MILICDSGTSKADWAVLDGNQVYKTFQTGGINVLYEEEDSMFLKLFEVQRSLEKFEIDEIHFYGAGAISPNVGVKLERVLHKLFSPEFVFVNSDLLAAARAGLNQQKGIVAIIGTGTNACVYSGRKIIKQIKPLGFVLGDEGSGAYLGKKLLVDYLRDQMPDNLTSLFELMAGSTGSALHNKMIRTPLPVKEYAQLAQFAIEHQSDPYIQQKLIENFELFFSVFILPLTKANPKLKVSFIGSFAASNRRIIEHLAATKSVQIANFVQYPIEGLISYHQKNLR